MQDYPQHLLQAQILRVHNDPAFDYNEYFEFQLRAVYATFYLTTFFFSAIVPIEIAGKLSLSLYVILVAAVVVRFGRRFENEDAPWGALLFFPMAFNQLYFLGMVNYLLSLPLLILALLDYDDLMSGTLNAWRIFRNFLWQVALFITHPFSFLVYVLLAIVASFMARRDAHQFWAKVLISMGPVFLLLIAFWVESAMTSAPKAPAADIIAWTSPIVTAAFFFLMFNGMAGSGEANPTTLALWGAIIVIVIKAMFGHRREQCSLQSYILFPAIVAVGLFILPFRIGAYTYINLRLTAIAYFLIALLVARVQFKGWLRYTLIMLVGLCMIDSSAKQVAISEEVSEIVPIVRRIPANSRILPLVFDHTSPELQKGFFDPHINDHNYYHILVGGGFNPYLPLASVNPVKYKKGAERPAPGEYRADGFLWEEHAADYQYFLIRGAPKEFVCLMKRTCDQIAISGEWMLFERKSKAGDARERSRGSNDEVDPLICAKH